MDNRIEPQRVQGTASQKKIIRAAAIALMLLVSCAGVYLVIAKIVSKKNQQGSIAANQGVLPEGNASGIIVNNVANLREQFDFPKYDYSKSQYTPSVPDYQLRIGDLANLSSFEKVNDQYDVLSPLSMLDAQKAALEKDNFFLAENKDEFFGSDPNQSTHRVDDWTDMYGKIGGPWAAEDRKPQNSVFITSDFLLHTYHRLLSKEFEYVEQNKFYSELKDVTDKMLGNAITAYNSSQDQKTKESYQRLITYFAVPSAVLNSSKGYHDSLAARTESYGDSSTLNEDADSIENTLAGLEALKSKIPAGSYDVAKQELALVMGAESIQQSPLFGKYQNEQNLGFNEDYSQYGPRSHYAKNPILRSYFRAMMWYGRQNFLIRSPELSLDAMHITADMNKLGLVGNWDDIYVATSFFVGSSDDLGIYDYKKVLDENGGNITAEMMGSLQEKMANIKNPQIMSSSVAGDEVLESSKEELQAKTKGFRFMGQRFTPDAFVFSTLTQGDEKADPKTGEKLPSMPTALMVFSALGNQTASRELGSWITQNAQNSKNVINNKVGDLKTYFSGLSDDFWTQNIYWSWLHTLRSLSQEDLDKAGYPNFMKNDRWNTKNLQCSLGSWTELKHDTLLYAKQSYAEMGGGGPEGEVPPVPKGYVEPNIEFFDRIIPLAKMTYEGLAQRKLIDQEFEGRNIDFITALEFFRKIAIAEVNNATISDDDFESLRLAGGRLSSVIRAVPGEVPTEDLARSALIADVHTDALRGNILYEADGIPNYIYVAVKDSNGTRLTKGLVYSHYEFKYPIGQRLTDAVWKEWIYGGKSENIPPAPTWSLPVK